MIFETPFVHSQTELRMVCSRRVHNIEVNITQAGEMQPSNMPRKKRMAKKPLKLKTVACNMQTIPQTNSMPPTSFPTAMRCNNKFQGHAPP